MITINLAKLIIPILLSMFLFGCNSSQQQTKWVTDGSDSPIEPRPVMVIKPAETQQTQKNQIIKEEKDVVKEAQERFQEQRKLDQEASKQWWDDVRSHQIQIIQMNQQFQKDMAN